MKNSDGNLTGIVTSRVCPLCGHHEIGFAKGDGGFFPLKPGMVIQIVNGPQTVESIEKIAGPEVTSDPETVEYVPWVPDPAMPHKRLRLKYGLKVRVEQMAKEMSPEIYRMAYLDKLRELIEKELYIPIPVILDRFFTAPQLATGDSMQIAEAMWKELREVREPVGKVEEWLVSRDPSLFSEETGDEESRDSNEPNHPGEESVLEELNNLTLEDFLGLL